MATENREGKKEEERHIYVVNGWTNHYDEQLKVYSAVTSVEEPTTREVPAPATKLVVSNTPATRGTAGFSRHMLFHLGLLPFGEARLKVSTGSVYFPEFGKIRDYRNATRQDVKNGKILRPGHCDDDIVRLDDAITFGNVRGLYLGINEEGECRGCLEHVDLPERQIKKIFPGILSLTNFLSTIPGRSKVCSGKRALDYLVNNGLECWTEIVRGVILHCEGGVKQGEELIG